MGTGWIFKASMPNVKSMMLIRGQNLVAYTNFPDDVVYQFRACRFP